MAMNEMVIEVNGLPDNYPENMIIDKLTMHFLRRSNKGGEVLTVIYPTSNKGQAYVVFESAEGIALIFCSYPSLTSYSMANIFFFFFFIQCLSTRSLATHSCFDCGESVLPTGH